MPFTLTPVLVLGAYSQLVEKATSNSRIANYKN